MSQKVSFSFFIVEHSISNWSVNPPTPTVFLRGLIWQLNLQRNVNSHDPPTLPAGMDLGPSRQTNSWMILASVWRWNMKRTFGSRSVTCSTICFWSTILDGTGRWGGGCIGFPGDEGRSEINLYLECTSGSVLGGLIAYLWGSVAGCWRSLDWCWGRRQRRTCRMRPPHARITPVFFNKGSHEDMIKLISSLNVIKIHPYTTMKASPQTQSWRVIPLPQLDPDAQMSPQ